MGVFVSDRDCDEVTKVKVIVLHPVQQPGSFWDRFSALSLVGLECDLIKCNSYIMSAFSQAI